MNRFQILHKLIELAREAIADRPDVEMQTEDLGDNYVINFRIGTHLFYSDSFFIAGMVNEEDTDARWEAIGARMRASVLAHTPFPA